MFCKTKYEVKFTRTDVDTDGWKSWYIGSGKATRHLAEIVNNSSDVIITRVEWIIKHNK